MMQRRSPVLISRAHVRAAGKQDAGGLGAAFVFDGVVQRRSAFAVLQMQQVARSRGCGGRGGGTGMRDVLDDSYVAALGGEVQQGLSVGVGGIEADVAPFVEVAELIA